MKDGKVVWSRNGANSLGKTHMTDPMEDLSEHVCHKNDT